jgi:DNA-binding response OmpR family regulator
MKRRSALIIESDAQSAKLLSTVLEREGWLVIVSHSVEGGRRLLDVMRTDLIVLEPGSSHDVAVGYVYALRRASADSVPIVIVSSVNDWSPLPPGCLGFVRKPIDITTFPAQLTTFLEGS